MVEHAHLAAARPRVVAALTRSFRDLDLAEDGFQEASVRALENWPSSGVPRDPTAWLIRTGRNLIIDRMRRLGRETTLPSDLTAATGAEDDQLVRIDRLEMRDDVLRLLFMCCHETLTVPDQLALALKVVAGFPTDKLARAFVVKPRTMEQRITRAKKKAATAGTLRSPTREQRARRLDAVGKMVYLLFNEGYSGTGGDIHIHGEMCEEAIRLARLLLELFPAQPELMGLLALCLLQHSRRTARLGTSGELIPLEEQDRSRWNAELISEGCVLVEKALRKGAPGPFQIQAAIAATHATAPRFDATNWLEIERLYAALEQFDPSPIVSLNRAVAIARVRGPELALSMTEPLAATLDEYLHFHAARAAMLAEAGRAAEARRAYARALALHPTRAEADYLSSRLAALEAG